MPDNLDRIMELQARMQQMPQASCEVLHHHLPGVYCREMHMPAGVVVVGKMHRTEHLNILSAGQVAVATPESDVVVYEAPCMIRSQPGTKRVLLALTDVVWTNIHSNPDNIVDEAELDKTYVVEPGHELEYVRTLLLKED